MTLTEPTIAELRTAAGRLINVTPSQAMASGATPAEIDAALSAKIIASAQAEVLSLGAHLYTPDAVLAVIYRAKFAEAEKYIAAGRPANVSAAEYPLLTAEAPARGVTKAQLADLIIATAASWQGFAGAMEAARVKISQDVKAAGTFEGKQAAARAVINALIAAMPG